MGPWVPKMQICFQTCVLTKTYVFEGYAGSDLDYKLPIRVVAKKAWQYMFCRNMFINIKKIEKKLNQSLQLLMLLM